MSSITANSRMVYAFSRDGAVPFSDFWHHVSKSARVPVRTAWFGAVGAFILALPYLYNIAAYAAVTSIAVIGLYIAYLTPVFLRRINPSAFKPGPWVLGKTWGPIINWIAIIWVVFIVILLMLPAVQHRRPWSRDFTWTAFNYAPIAVLVVVGGAGLWYAVSARKWFKGPKVQGTAEELAEIERDLTHLSRVDSEQALPERGGPARPAPFSCSTAAAPRLAASRAPRRERARERSARPARALAATAER